MWWSQLSYSLARITFVFLSFLPSVLSIHCLTCANDFVVWHWRHLFLKRNYGLTSSDQSCMRHDYTSENLTPCLSTCFILYLNATNRYSGQVSVLGVGRGCSSQFLTDEQYAQIGLGTHSKISEVSSYLPSKFDVFDINEHWCFCATDQCNKDTCYSQISDLLSVTYKKRDYGFDIYNWWTNGSSSFSLNPHIFKRFTILCFMILLYQMLFFSD
ncbi:hypothetical protein AB6A40_003375 [Gnathostoma spinigerum]|uniref:Uncharacterized protein n=1 Tax=Gnathostoma spinigerum TaxID=75299 RepID=A0ABD6EBU7_9BILA